MSNPVPPTPTISPRLLEFSSSVIDNIRFIKKRQREMSTDSKLSGMLDSWDDEDGDEPTVNDDYAKMWAQYGHTYTPCEKAIPKLGAGQYTIGHDDSRGVYFEEKQVVLDDLVILPDTVSEEILDHIQDFWAKEDRYRSLGFLWKRGVLIYGPPGSGKTSTIQLLSAMIIEKGGLAIYISAPSLAARGLELLRRIEPKRPIIAILEDLDAIIAHNPHTEADLLSLIDGELQIDNIVFVATTNYPEDLDKRLTNRPSRFDVVREIGMPTDAARTVFLTAKNERLAKPENQQELKTWVDLSKGFSIAHMKEMIICVECYEHTVQAVAKRLKKMMEVDVKVQDNGRDSFGFKD